MTADNGWLGGGVPALDCWWGEGSTGLGGWWGNGALGLGGWWGVGRAVWGGWLGEGALPVVGCGGFVVVWVGRGPWRSVCGRMAC